MLWEYIPEGTTAQVRDSQRLREMSLFGVFERFNFEHLYLTIQSHELSVQEVSADFLRLLLEEKERSS